MKVGSLHARGTQPEHYKEAGTVLLRLVGLFSLACRLPACMSDSCAK